jgi:hypothetical protein
MACTERKQKPTRGCGPGAHWAPSPPLRAPPYHSLLQAGGLTERSAVGEEDGEEWGEEELYLTPEEAEVAVSHPESIMSHLSRPSCMLALL